jgi:hypothetical protein
MIKKLYIIINLFLVLGSLGFAQTTYYSQNGGNVTKTSQNYTSSITDTSGVLVTNSGVFTLSNSTITTTGNSSSTNNSSQYGLNAGVYAKSNGKITMTDCSVSTTGSGANGLFATGSGSIITMTNGTIKATGGNAHGIDVTYTGTITLTNVNSSTTGGSSSDIATDFGGGTVTVNGGTHTCSGSKSAGIYSTGLITVNDAAVTSTGDNGSVIDADGIIVINNTKLTGSKNGLKIHNTVGQMTLIANFTINGGSMTANGGDGFYISTAKGIVNIKNSAVITTSTGNIVNALTSANLTFTVDGTKLTGNLIADSSSTLTASFKNNSSLSGIINSAALTLDATSSWNVTGTSYLSTFSDASGISGTSITNITGNGYNVYYNSNLSGNSSLGGKTYSLLKGGVLTPKTTTVVKEVTANIPADWKLDQNYPNPFNPATNFSFTLPQASNVTLKIYDIFGREVITLINDYYPAGSHSFSWNAGSISSGTYFYRLQAASKENNTVFSDSKKLLLMK